MDSDQGSSEKVSVVFNIIATSCQCTLYFMQIIEVCFIVLNCFQYCLSFIFRYPMIRCVVYTGDKDVTATDILETAYHRFQIKPAKWDRNFLDFVFLNTRECVEARRYPYFTLLGQSLGSLVLGLEALWKCNPDVYIDTMGYAFTLPLFKYLGGCKVACYVHYPTISTDMIERVFQQIEGHNNAGAIARSPILSFFKQIYYRLFANLYGMVGRASDVIMVNSSWTRGHIDSLWQAPDRTHTVYPPCDTKPFLDLPLKSHPPESQHTFVSIAQFRPEKDHPLQIKSFYTFLNAQKESNRHRYRLFLVGSCRNKEDDERLNSLMKLAEKLGISQNVVFKRNSNFNDLKTYLNNATIGLHTMWNEHFGIGE